jgi:hypothetical protein
MMEIKTSEEIAHGFYTQPELSKFEEKIKFNKERWVAIDEDLDLYRELINKYGKVNIWGLNVDEICEKIEEMFKNSGKTEKVNK